MVAEAEVLPCSQLNFRYRNARQGRVDTLICIMGPTPKSICPPPHPDGDGVPCTTINHGKLRIHLQL